MSKCYMAPRAGDPVVRISTYAHAPAYFRGNILRPFPVCAIGNSRTQAIESWTLCESYVNYRTFNSFASYLSFVSLCFSVSLCVVAQLLWQHAKYRKAAWKEGTHM